MNVTTTLSKVMKSCHVNFSGWKGKRFSAFLFMALTVVFSSSKIYGQTLANYTFSSNTTGSLQDMTGATVLLTGNNDDAASSVIPIGFDFYFMGTKYTHISANSNGQARLHTSATATAIGSSNVSSFSSGNATFALFSGDNELNGGMSAIVLGSAPNRKFVLEWNQFYVFYTNISNSGNMQLVLNESSGVVEYVYGNIINSSSSNQTRSIFISSSNTATTAGSVTIGATPSFTLGTTPVSNTIAASLPIANIAGTVNGNLRTFIWAPNLNPTPAAPINLTISGITTSTLTPNWTDNSTNESFFIVTRAIDPGFTIGVSTTIVSSTTVATTGDLYTLPQTGLQAATTYYYRIQAANEGFIPSATISGNETTLPGNTYFWVGGATGTWNTPANWNTQVDGNGASRTSPETTDALIVDGAGSLPGGPVLISIDAASYTIGQLLVTNNTSLTLQSATTATRTITVSGGNGDDLLVDQGSSLIMNNTTQAAAIAFTGSNITGLIEGTLTFGGSTSNVLTTTGGTNTLVTIGASGIVNLGAAGNTLVGSVATLNFSNGSICNSTGATTGAPPVPLATWGTTSNLNISGLTSSTTTATNNVQSFGNVTYNCPLSTATMSFWGSSTTAVVKGNLTIQATNTGKFRATTSGAVTVNGNLIINNGTFEVGSTTGTVNVAGNVTLNGGTLDIAFGGASTLKVAGNFTQTGGTLTQSNVAGNLEFNGVSPQTFTPTTTTGNIGVRLNNTTGVNLSGNINLNRLTVSEGSLSGIGVITYNSTTSSLVYNSTTSNQTINNNEFPSTNGPVSLTINNTSSGSLVTLPFPRSLAGTTGVLTLTAGILNNSGNTLTITNTAANAVVGGSATSYVRGSIERTLPANLVSGSTYVFPIGKASYNPMDLINPTSSGVVVINAEVFDAVTGGTPSALFSALNTDRYWATSFTSGQSNFAATASTAIRLNDAPGTADGIAGSATLNGVYDIVGGVSITATSTSLTTSAPLASIPAFMVMAVKAAPSFTNLLASPAGNVCLHVARNINVNVTPGGTPVQTVVLNYAVNNTPQTPISMTNSTNNGGLNLDTWTGTIPTVTPINATVTWSIVATDANGLSKTITGTSYADSPSLGAAVAITPSIPNFCGTGGSATLTASSSDPTMAFTWAALTTSSTLSASTGTTVTATVTETSDFSLTGTNPQGCVSTAFYSLGVYPLPTAAVTTTANGVCPGTSATINSGLSAGNFSAVCISHTPLTPPATPTFLVTNGVQTVTLASGTLDDGGWSNVPLGFTFNYFGTNYTSVNVGTNGVLQFGTYNGTALGDYTIGALPNTSDPLGAIFAAANDLNCGTSDGVNPTSVKYWINGYAPNRRFVIEYDVFRYGSTQRHRIQVVLVESLGTIEMHAIQLASINPKTIGVNNPTGTVGAAAPNCAVNPNTQNYWQAQTATIASGSGQSWRFSPPANYTTTWSATDVNGTTQLATGTNIFTQSVTPAITTTYSISYTNQTTGCTNAPNSAQVQMTVLGTTAPTGVVASASVASVCSGVSFTLSANYTGSSDGLTYQWQASTNNGVDWTNIPNSNSLTLTTTQAVNSIYRLSIVSCGGTESLSNVVTVNATTPTDCYCTPVYTTGTSDGDLISNVQIIGTTLSNNTGFVAGGPSYTFFTGQANYTATLVPSTNYTLSISTGEYGSQGYAAWIDYNDNGVFESTERIGATTGTIGSGVTLNQVNATSTFVIALACTPPTGVHRMRVRGAFNVSGVDIDPCTSYGFGETEDYLVTITAPLTCPNPGLLTAGTTTSTTANLSWTLGCSTATAFDFEYGPVGFSQGTGTLVSNVSATTSTTITGLIPNSEYQVYYRANCGNGEVSAWSLPVNVTTPCAPITLTNPGAQVACGLYTLPTISEVTPSNNNGLALSYRTAANGGGSAILGAITTTQTVHIYGVAGACTANESFLVTINNSNTSSRTETACASYTWNTTTYTISGSYTQTFTNSVGCDSVATLNLTINQPSASSLTVLACQTYTLNNQTYTSSGIYTQTLVNAVGCDSTITLNLTIGQPNAISLTETACGSYSLNGTVYTQTGTYTQTLTNIFGCDSVLTLNLTINQPTASTLNELACQLYTLNNQTYTASGIYTQTLTNVSGCDSTITLNLTIGQPNSVTLTQFACTSFDLNGTIYTQNGTYTQTLTNMFGCDSVITLDLTLGLPSASTLNVQACQTYTLNSEVYTTSGTYTQTISNASGCDSVITLNLTIGQPEASTMTETACGSFTLNGTVYTQSGTYTETFTSIYGCDSVVTLNLTILNNSTSTTTVTECVSYTWTNGTNYTVSGIYTQQLTNSVGCDSTATLILTIGNNSSTTTATVCGSYTWTNGTTYTQSGTYTQTLVNASGCDSLVTLNLTINPTPTATAVDNGNGTGTLVASSGTTYQWIECTTNSPISGATSATYTAPINGSYAVIITNASNCSATSSCVIVDYLSLEENTLSFNVYPNPTNGTVNIAVNQSTANYNVTVEDMNGRLVANYGSIINGNGIYSLDLSSVIKGVYFIKLKNESEQKTVRIIIQ
ncbi:MAG: T9SS type A sorting domain-containing protein [Flavobacteriales bacterium]|nr:T9SS type A sorting domain-containing protein [Flavobacteriales bacterium]